MPEGPPSPDSPDSRPEPRIGRYQVVKELGRGATGVVYLAHDPRVGRRIALKTFNLPEDLPGERRKEFRERFLREAQAAGILAHPAIVTIHDAGEDETGVPFIAMELVDGGSLQELLRAEGRLAPRRVTRMGVELAGALDAAHRSGVVHRDVKPANILIRRADDAFKLADFGIARLDTSDLTRSGAVPGSPAYMSPEQIRGESIDGRSDLFSLGVVLYQALCGARPFEGKDLTSLAWAIIHETPAPAGRRAPGVDPRWNALLDKALAKKPEDRFQSGADMAAALRGLEGRSAGPNPETTLLEMTGTTDDSTWLPAPRLPRRWVVRAAAIGAAALLAGWPLWSWHRKATLILDARSTFEDATLSVLVDGEEVYSRLLVAERKSARLLGKKLFEYGDEEFQTSIGLSPGRHEILAQVRPGEGNALYQDSLVVLLEPRETKRLKLVSKGAREPGVVLEPD